MLGNSRSVTERLAHRACVFLFVLIALAAAPLSAQTPPPPGTSAAVIQQQIDAAGLRTMLKSKIATSGMTTEQVRQRLASMGYDPAVLDPYLGESEQNLPAPTPGTLAAVRALGIPEVDPAAAAGAATDTRPEPALPTPEETRLNLRVFGTEVFSRGSSEFEPVTTAALPSSYALGPGDEIVLVITGDVELNYVLPVTREGFVLIPQVGQVWVNGLTLAALRDQLFSRLGNVYSGIERSSDARTRFDISIARTRSNQIFISGDVTRPGSYVVSPMASVLNVLYQAGGPTGNGSFRNVQVVRGGNVIATVDLYRYLLSGDNLSGIRLESGDVIFVPVHGPHVAIKGEVAREAIYEMRPGETIANLIQLAGGLNAPAHTRRARVSRILPPGERREPGVDRVVTDVDLAAALENPAKAPTVASGDMVEVLRVNEEVRRTVSIAGSIWREGTFELRPGMRVWDLINASDGLKPDAYATVAHISRKSPVNGSLTVIPFSLERTAAGQPEDNPELKEDDIVRIFSRAESNADITITVSGAVRNASSERFQQGMTLHDAILRAGGLRENADPTVEISRVAAAEKRAGGELVEVIKIKLDSTYFLTDESAANYLGNRSELRVTPGEKSAGSFPLRPMDRIFVRSIPEFEEQRIVQIGGEVKYPGPYALRRKDERLLDLIQRAGGLTATAYPAGFKLTRDAESVDIDLEAALKNPADRNNVPLQAGDVIIIPEFDPVVLVRGAVGSPTAVLYRKGADLEYYIASAGGYARNADKGRVFVKYPNGRSETRHRTALLFKSSPDPEPGSTVTVPFRLAEDRVDTRGIVADMAQILAALGTVVLAITRL
jgi:protein involved in polysaccharide export with SLBB domain